MSRKYCFIVCSWLFQEWRQKKPEFADFIATQESRPELMMLSIDALLIMPVQRIPRWILSCYRIRVYCSCKYYSSSLDLYRLLGATQQLTRPVIRAFLGWQWAGPAQDDQLTSSPTVLPVVTAAFTALKRFCKRYFQSLRSCGRCLTDAEGASQDVTVFLPGLKPTCSSAYVSSVEVLRRLLLHLVAD